MHVEIQVPNYSEIKAISCSICTKLRCPRSLCLAKKSTSKLHIPESEGYSEVKQGTKNVSSHELGECRHENLGSGCQYQFTSGAIVSSHKQMFLWQMAEEETQNPRSFQVNMTGIYSGKINKRGPVSNMTNNGNQHMILSSDLCL